MVYLVNVVWSQMIDIDSYFSLGLLVNAIRLIFILISPICTNMSNNLTKLGQVSELLPMESKLVSEKSSKS